MTACTFLVVSNGVEFCIRVSHDGHPDGCFSKPLFKVLKNEPNPTVETVILALMKAEDPSSLIEIYNDEQYACSSDYECRINLNKRTWKYCNHKRRSF